MSSPLYQMYGQQPQQPAQQPQNIISEFMNFRNNFQGDPKAQRAGAGGMQFRQAQRTDQNQSQRT